MSAEECVFCWRKIRWWQARGSASPLHAECEVLGFGARPHPTLRVLRAVSVARWPLTRPEMRAQAGVTGYQLERAIIDLEEHRELIVGRFEDGPSPRRRLYTRA